MTGQAQEIVTMFEVCGLSIEDIAAETSLEPISVKACLLQNSPRYREEQKEAGKADGQDVTDEEFDALKQAYKQLALYSDNDNVRERALRFLFQEKKGRNESKKAIQNIGKMNVIVFNERLLKAKELKKKFIESVVDVQSEKVA